MDERGRDRHASISTEVKIRWMSWWRDDEDHDRYKSGTSQMHKQSTKYMEQW